ncbi:MAG: hypothetical protein HQ503_08745 [Rhodospirillales bacterium]|nr:hypothetical protein [Rhodospirillales bacterium]
MTAEDISPFELYKRPELVLKIMQVISIWAFTEKQHVSLAAKFLNSDFEVVFDMLNALVSVEGRRAAIIAAAKSALNDDDFNLYEATMRTMKASRDRRNDYAHHIWTVTDHLPDALLLIDPKYLVQHDAELERAYLEIDQTTFEEGDKISLPGVDHSKIMVYREPDFRKDLGDARLASLDMLILEVALSSRPSSDQARSELLSSPRIQQALQRKSNGNS